MDVDVQRIQTHVQDKAPHVRRFGLILLRRCVTNVLRHGELHEALMSHMTPHIKSP